MAARNPSLPLLSGSGSTGSLWNGHGELYVDRNNQYAAISDTEMVRIQRAFYLYELYSVAGAFADECLE